MWRRAQLMYGRGKHGCASNCTAGDGHNCAGSRLFRATPRLRPAINYFFSNALKIDGTSSGIGFRRRRVGV
jgi:hypothetical protein